MKCKHLLMPLLMGLCFSSTLLYAQTITSDPVSANVANFTLTGEINTTTGVPYNTAYFILFGDGQYAIGGGSTISRFHKYPAGFNGSATAWFAKKKDSSPPPMVISSPVVFGTGTNTFSNPPNIMPNNVKLSSSWIPVAGQQHFVIFTITNKCPGSSQYGSAKFYFNAPQITYDPANFAAFNPSPGTITSTSITPTSSLNFNQVCTWNYSNLLYGEQRHFFLLVNVDPSLAEGSTIPYKAVITQSKSCGQNISANIDTLSLTSGTFPHDPNKKTVDTENICANYNAVPLEYHIAFQNDGSAEAEDVVVYDDLDASQLDVNTLTLTGFSYPCQQPVIPPGGNTAIFEFMGIKLPGLNQTDPYQYGYNETIGDFSFTINTLPNLNPGVIPNVADIKFDALPIVQTNIAHVYINENMGNDACPVRDRSNASTKSPQINISASPNPFSDQLTIHPSSIQLGETALLEICNLSGRCFSQQSITDNTALSLDTAAWPSGIYFIRFQTSSAFYVQRVVKP